MSYRNPRIIDDKSGLVLGQAMQQAVQGIGQNIIAMEARDRAAREKSKVLQDKERKGLIEIQNKHSNNSAAFNKGLEGMTESMRTSMIAENEANLKRVDEISILQQGGDTSMELSNELGALQTQFNSDVAFGKTIIATTTTLQENMEQWEKLGKTRFYKEEILKEGEEPTTERSVAIIDGFGGAPGYESGVERKPGKGLFVYSITPSNMVDNVEMGKKRYEISASEFKTIANDFMVDIPNSAEEIRGNIVTQMFKGGKLTGNALAGKTSSNIMVTEADGDQSYYDVTTISPAAIATEKNTAFARSLASIVGASGNRQAQSVQLTNLGISPEEYKNAGNEQEGDKEGDATARQRKLVERSSNKNFDAALEQEGVFLNKKTTTTGEGDEATTVTTTSYEMREKDPTKSITLTEAQKKLNLSDTTFNDNLNSSVTAYDPEGGISIQEHAASSLNKLFDLDDGGGDSRKFAINTNKKQYRNVQFVTKNGKLFLRGTTGSKADYESTAGVVDRKSLYEPIDSVKKLTNILSANVKMSELQKQRAIEQFENTLQMNDSFFNN